MILQPYPGTQIDRYARDSGYFDGDYSAIGYNYYFRSPLRFRSESERRQIENSAEVVRRGGRGDLVAADRAAMMRLPPNLIFTSVFRWWYSWCYLRRIMRYRLRWADVFDTLRVLFGFYPKGTFHASLEEDRPPVRVEPG